LRDELPYRWGMSGNHAALDEAIVILTTPRLILRAAIESDIPILQERVFGDGDVMRHAFAGVPMTKGEADAFMRAHFTFGGSLTGLATLTERAAGDVLGFAGLLPSTALGAGDFEIGFVLSRHAWGRGIATEIGEAQLAFGFDRLACRRLLGLVEPANVPSIRALGKLGMKHFKDIEPAGRAKRSVYVIEAVDWRRRRAE
jgi:RimJ/RimL family protein N-acetyltransferase